MWVSKLTLNTSRSLKRVIGVGGLSLGGGYSWKTAQFGLTIDNIVAHNLVLTNGEQVRVTDKTNPDLFLALKVKRITNTQFV